MQWTNDRYQQETQQDVYADVRNSYAASPFAQSQDTQEFSLSSIQEKLGELSTVEEADVRGASADLMPSSQTLNMSYQREYTSETTRAASKLSTKGKVMIACYALAVFLLIAAIAWCGSSVTANFDKALAKNVDYTQVAGELDALLSQVEAEDYTELDRRAKELGYSSASSSNTMEYTEIDHRDEPNFHVESNWFDAFCDWLCKIFGA